jgi:GNAT superfamily N-acetyltransferase
VRLLSESFCREPMAVALGTSVNDLAALIARFMPECKSNGLSVVAVPEDEPKTVVAAFLSRDFKSPMPEGILEANPWFLPIAQALMSVGETYEAMHPHLNLGDVADLWMVATDTRFAQRGIAGRLFSMCTDLARDRGFKRCVTECTGHYSQTAARRAGFEEVTRLAYRDFRFDGRAVFAGIPLPHAHLVLYERKL